MLAGRAARAAYTGYRKYQQYKPYVDTAVSLGRYALKRKSEWKVTPNKRQKTVNGKTGAKKRKPRLTVGEYAGRFNRKKSKVFSVEKKFAKVGATSSIEVCGEVSDSKVVYVGHSAQITNEQFRLLMIALYRRLLEKGLRYKIDSPNRVFDTEMRPTFNSLIMRVSFKTSTGTFQTAQYNIVTGADTLVSLSAIANPVSDIFWKLATDSAFQGHQLMELTLFQETGTLATQSLLLAQLELSGMRVMCTSKSILKIQNVTQFRPESDEADDVNAVHLNGRNYMMSSNYPITQLDTLGEFYVNNVATGIILTGGSVLASAAADRSWNEVPNKGVFSHCKGASLVNLGPGKIKTDTIIHSISLPILEYLRSTVSQYRTSVMKARGKCHLIALEKMIGFGTAAIKVYYEKSQWTGVMIKESKSSTQIQDAFEFTKNYP